MRCYTGETVVRTDPHNASQVLIEPFVIASESGGIEWVRLALSERVEALQSSYREEFHTEPEVVLMCVLQNPTVDDGNCRFQCGLAMWATEPKELAHLQPRDVFAFQMPGDAVVDDQGL